MLTIWGIEATQSTQFFKSTHPLCRSGATPAPCPDNSVPLVAEKPTVLRLYVSGATPGALLGGVATGSGSQSPYGPGTGIVGVAGMTASARPATRTDPTTTLQVLLKPHVAGTFTFTVIVVEYGPTGNVVASAASSITLEFVERRRVRIRLVRIHFTGRGMNVAAPTVKEFWDATDLAQRLLPVAPPGFEIVKESEAVYDGDFSRIDPGAHDQNWPGYAANRGTTGNLLNILDTLASAESLPGDVVYAGIYPANTSQAAFAGWSVARWLISSLDGMTLAHELGHKIGLAHAPCGGAAAPDAGYPDYPAFSPLPAASIGEVGLDSSNMSVFDPQSTYDLMSYCGPKWISPHNYVGAFGNLPPLPPATPSPAGRLDRPDRFVALSFQHVRDRWVVVDLPGFARPLPPPPPPLHAGYEVLVRDGKG